MIKPGSQSLLEARAHFQEGASQFFLRLPGGGRVEPENRRDLLGLSFAQAVGASRIKNNQWYRSDDICLRFFPDTILRNGRNAGRQPQGEKKRGSQPKGAPVRRFA